jgi:hypothetical protein
VRGDTDELGSIPVSPGWPPTDRLALVEALQARSGASSQSFFDAHGLGAAYRSAGDKNSKRAKINEALHAAERRGDLDEILDAAAAFVGLRRTPDQSTTPRRPDPPEGATVRAEPLIFFSHAFADKALADLLRNTLLLGGVPEQRIFYSSDRSSGIPSGQDVGSYLRRSLQDAGLVIELISETFLTRPMCLMELGGAWAMETPTYPIVVPPLARDEAIKQIGNVQIGVLGTETEIDSIFDELADRLDQNLGVRIKTTAWNRAIKDFKEQLPSKLVTAHEAAASAPIPPPVAAVAAASSGRGDKITLHNISIVGGPLNKELHGEATNHDVVEHSATIKATFYGADGKIVGSLDGVVNQLRPGGTKTFSLHDTPEHSRFKVDVDMIV